MVVQVDDLCKQCSNFIWGEYECGLGNYIDDSKTTIECDDYKSKESEDKKWKQCLIE